MSDLGAELHAHVEALFPLCRSITGQGLRATLRYIGDRVPLRVTEVPSGTAVLDWTVPLEWTIRDAAISRLDGERIIDFQRSNLHLLQYSHPIDRIVSCEELDAHLYSLPGQPNLIPYRTSYYSEAWGFCLAHRDRLALKEDRYHVFIDSALEPGSLSYGECVLPGELDEEVLISAHCCHPSLANDNVSSIAVAVELVRALSKLPRRFTYRFLFAPGTIGAIAWLHFNRDAPERVRHGLVLSCLGDTAAPSYKRSRRGDAPIDRYAAAVLQEEGHGDRILPFVPMGYDERQYCSPGFNLPMGCLMRSPGGTFPEYHTSADNPRFVRPEALADSLRVLRRIVTMIEGDGVWCSTCPFGEPQLGRRGLYPPAGGSDMAALLWVMNLADGQRSLLEMAERSGKSFEQIAAAAAVLAGSGLLVRAE